MVEFDKARDSGPAGIEADEPPYNSSGLVTAPLHEQIKERILRQILLGEWSEGDVLPPETELARTMGVSYGTIRRAMTDLTRLGAIQRRRRTGTVVTGRSPHHTLNQFYRYYRLHSADGRLVNTEARTISASHRPATAEEAERLGIPSGAEVATIERLRFYEGRPVMIDRIAIPLSRAPDFPDVPEDAPHLIYKWLLEHHELRLVAVRERVTARLASREDKLLLECDPDEPLALLDIDEVAFDALNKPLLTMRHLALTDAHCYVNEIR